MDNPFLISDFVRPACLPPIGWARKLNGGKMVISGMGKTPQSSLRSSNMEVATITMKSQMECKNNPFIGLDFIGKLIALILPDFRKIHLVNLTRSYNIISI